MTAAVMLTMLLGAAPTYALTPAALQAEITRRGAQPVLDEVYGNEARWAVVRGGIASGARPWLDVAVRLKQEARGPASPEITAAVADALERAPAAVLRVLEPPLDPDNVCSLNTIEDTLGRVYDTALRRVQARARAVAAVRERDLAPRRDECVAFLQELEREVKANRTVWFDR